MNPGLVPISTFFIALNGFLALALSYIAAVERSRARIWHGASPTDVADQSDPLATASAWATTVEQLTKTFAPETSTPGLLQRKVRAHSNFAEYVPHGLLFLVALELMHGRSGILWSLGGLLTIARLAHAYGVISTYGPSIGRAIGFFATWFVYIAGSVSCFYYSVKTLIQ